MTAVIEHEVRLRVVDSEAVMKQLVAHGALLGSEHVQHRSVFDIPRSSQSWLRVRDSGVNTTLTVKSVLEGKVEELEVTVDSYETTLQFLAVLGLQPRANHENFRRNFTFQHSKLEAPVEIMLDTWPEIGHVLEIEGQSQADVMLAVSLLGFCPVDIDPLEVWQMYEADGLPGIKHRDVAFSAEEIAEWNLPISR